MRVLAIETATEGCSAALWDGETLFSRSEELGRGHAERILGMVDELLAEARIDVRDLAAIAVDRGPGAFTGVRIAISVAQGLAFGANLPVVAVSSLEALALPLLQGGAATVLACLDARMGEVYWGLFGADPTQGVISVQAPAVGLPAGVAVPAMGPAHGVGRGFAAYPGLRQIPGLRCADVDSLALPDARAVAVIGRLRFLAGAAVAPQGLAPLYLRDKVALTERERGAL